MPKLQFEAVGGHPAANFINTLDERLSAHPVDRLSGYASLLKFCLEAGLLDAPSYARLEGKSGLGEANKVLATARQFREDLFAVLFSALSSKEVPPKEFSSLKIAFTEVAANRQLIFWGNSFRWEWKEPDNVTRPWWEVALAAEDLLLDKNFSKLKKCAAADCGVVFLDDSRGGNRQKVRQFRANRQSPTPNVPDPS